MATDISLRRTPLYEAHMENNARIVDFAGWAMPVLYTSILDEARSVRNGVGIFDISHMGRAHIRGPGATRLLQELTTNDVEALKSSQAQYSLLTNANGGIIDDIIVYRVERDNYMIIINASNTEKDISWIRAHGSENVHLVDNTATTAMIAVQGPLAPALVADLADNRELLSMDRFQHTNGRIGDNDAIFCRTGYTGEDGFEIITGAAASIGVWKRLLEGGATPCGLGARDALRIEAGYPLYGHEIDDETSPVDAGLMWVVRLEKGDFIGADVIRARKQDGPPRKLVGLRSTDRLQPRQGYTIYSGKDAIGEITSGIFSPTRNVSVAMGYVTTQFARTGVEVEIAVREKRISATVCPKKSLLEDVKK